MSAKSSTKLLTRDEYREAVFARDKHRCVICDSPAVDVHHIVERKLWVEGTRARAAPVHLSREVPPHVSPFLVAWRYR